MKLKLHTFLVQFRRELSALFAGIAALIALSIVRPHPDVFVIAAAHDLPAGHIISAQDLSPFVITQPWPSAIRSSEDAVGHTLTHAVKQATPLNDTDLLSAAMTKNLPHDMRAVTIDISAADASLAQMGALIDVFGADGQQISGNSRVIGTNLSETTSLALNSRSTLSVVVSMTRTEVSQLASARIGGALTIAASSN